MTDQEILEKAIQKAIDGGYEPNGIQDFSAFKATIRNGQAWVRWFNDLGDEVIQEIEHVIFNHDFAKALWGEGIRKPEPGKVLMIGSRGNINFVRFFDHWMFHLKQMVIADDPIKYLGENT